MERELIKKELQELIDSNDGDILIDSIFNYFENKKCKNCQFSDLDDNDKYICEFMDSCVLLDDDFSCDKFILRIKND